MVNVRNCSEINSEITLKLFWQISVLGYLNQENTRLFEGTTCAMSSQDDCYFFFNSTCTKGDDCAFRHEVAALDNPIVCEQWMNGSCNKNPCHLRHGIQETPKLRIPCYYESQPSGCLNYNCQFLHQKPRPFRTEVSYNYATLPTGNQRPAMMFPRMNAPVPPQRYAPPQMQQYRGPPRHHADVSPRKMLPTAAYTPKFPAGEFRPPVFANPPREHIPNSDFSHVRSRTFERKGLRGNHVAHVERPQRHIFRPGSRDVMKNPPMRPPMPSREDRMTPNVNDSAHRNNDQGLLGEPPRFPFPFAGLFPFNILPPVLLPPRPEDSPVDKESAKRSARKLDSRRHRKSDKNVKRRDEKRSSQGLHDMKRRKEKRSSSKELKGILSKHRKVKKGSIASKRDRTVERTAGTLSTTKTGEKDRSPKEEEWELVGVKVKTLEEILRDKALKKLRERQQAKENSNVDTTTAVTSASSELQDFSSKSPGLNPEDGEINDSKDVNSLTKPVCCKSEKDSLSAKNIGAHDIAVSIGTAVWDLSLQAKTLKEIKHDKEVNLSVERNENSIESKREETNKNRDRRLKPLKPLKNIAKQKSLDEKNGKGDSGNSSNQTSDEDRKKPLPPLTRLTRTPHGKTLGDNLLKRKLKAHVADRQKARVIKVQKVMADSERVPSPEGSTLPDTMNKAEDKRPIDSEKETGISRITFITKEKETTNSGLKCTIKTLEHSKKAATSDSSTLAEKTNLRDVRLEANAVKTKGLRASTCLAKSKNETAASSLSEENSEHSRGFSTTKENSVGETDPTNTMEKKPVLRGGGPTEDSNVPGNAKRTKKVKLKRTGLLGTRNTYQNEGKVRSSFVRRIKVNRKKFVEVKDGVDQKNNPNLTNAASAKLLQDIDKAACYQQSLERETSSVPTSALIISQQPDQEKTGERSGEKAKLEDPPPKEVEQRMSLAPSERKSSLDRLVKEVSDDISKEDDFDEDLERAIAEMSPAPADDEDEVSNADDLLLDIEELINS